MLALYISLLDTEEQMLIWFAGATVNGSLMLKL